jgi:hypothetical protein
VAVTAGKRAQVRAGGSDGGRLRASWHPERRAVVFSHWRENVCVASTPVPVEELPTLVAVLARALAEAATGDRPGAGGDEDGGQQATGRAPWLGLGREVALIAQRSVGVAARSAVRLLGWTR